MNCHESNELAPLYFYGELSAEDEERYEDHLESCAACRREQEGLHALSQTMQRAPLEPSAAMLAECRQDLQRAVRQAGEPARPWARIGSGFQAFMSPILGLRQLAAAAALVTLGFVAARFTSTSRMPGTSSQANTVPAGFVSPDAVVSGIRSDPASGQVSIDVDETHNKVSSGSPDNAAIQELLLRALRDQANPGLRVQSVEILKDHTRSASVRQALLAALAHDANAGVRLKALEGLKAFASSDESVRKALTHAVLTDSNPAVRIQAIDLLTKDRDEALVGVYQEIVRTEGNNYVRLKCKDALRQMNASEGAF